MAVGSIDHGEDKVERHAKFKVREPSPVAAVLFGFPAIFGGFNGVFGGADYTGANLKDRFHDGFGITH